MTEAPTQTPVATACPACKHPDDHQSLLGCSASTDDGICGCNLITTYGDTTVSITSTGTVHAAPEPDPAPRQNPPHLTEAITPYAGTSGWSGSDGSRQRAVTADKNGGTRNRQNEVLRALSTAGYDGLTWAELGRDHGWHHGTASGVLSNLHKEGLIARLARKRDRCHIYVLPEHVNGRTTQEHGRSSTPRQTSPPISDEESRAVAALRAGVYRRREVDLALALIDRLTA